MNKIVFAKPVIAKYSATLHMTIEQAKVAHKLFANALFIKDGELVEPKEAIGALYGAEAVLAYMEKLGLEAHPLKEIDVDAILSICDTYDDAYDLLCLMRRVDMRNERVRKLEELDAPAIIMMNEYRMLQDTVDQLFFNRFTLHPITYTCPAEDEDEPDEIHIRTCVMDLFMREVVEG